MAAKKTKLMGFIRRKSQLDALIAQYQAKVSENPGDARAYLKLGDLYLEKKETKKGIEELKKAAECFTNTGFYLKSIAIYKKILRMDPEAVEICISLGELYQQNGLLGDALVQYRRAFNIYKKRQNLDKALHTLRKITRIDSRNLTLRMKLADFLYSEGLRSEALDELLQAKKELSEEDEVPEMPQLLARIEKIRKELGIEEQPQEIELLDAIEEKEPMDQEAVFSMEEEQLPSHEETYTPEDIPQVIELDTDQNETASAPQEQITEEEVSTKVDDDQIVRWLEEAWVYAEQGLFDEAEEIYNRILKMDPDNDMVRSRLQQLKEQREAMVSPKTVSKAFSKYKLFEESDRFDIASLVKEISVDTVRNEGETDLKVHYDLAQAYQDMGLFDEAIDEYRIASKDPKWETSCYVQMGRCQVEKGQLDEAIESFLKAISSGELPEQSLLEINYQLGVCYEKKGMVKEAIETFKRIEEKDKRFKDVHQRLKALHL